ncbi:response regulator transcription factor [Paracoccus sp. S-4012]|uniref:LuxR C-terminal-related transcriptional regulator n=1 Tax=Paracoccus sp. S-4012 TaxID=2665648 RepID=UPI0018A24312|nr:response regulator transcription factor [Paracoccus sp. S-4012]
MKELINSDRTTSLASAQPVIKVSDQEFFALIDNRRLERECFIKSIELLEPRLAISGYSTADEFVEAAGAFPRQWTVLFNIGNRQLSNADVVKELASIKNLGDSCAVVIVAPSDDLDQIIAALDSGVSGYVPANLGIEGMIEAARLAASGGVFLRFESLAKLRKSAVEEKDAPPEIQSLTGRQTAVAEALRRGKSNKTIAYDLNMCESTVKVHIRSIMRKLHATNRTEAAYKLNSILPA